MDALFVTYSPLLGGAERILLDVADGALACTPQYAGGSDDAPKVGTVTGARADAMSAHPFTVGSVDHGPPWRTLVRISPVDGDVRVVARCHPIARSVLSALAIRAAGGTLVKNCTPTVMSSHPKVPERPSHDSHRGSLA